MKKYPSIPKISEEFIGRDCIVFEKLDGSCLSFEWSKKRGWYKSSTRNHLFDRSEPTFGCAVDIFNNTHAEALTKVIQDKYPKTTEVLAFLEFVGPHSFAGLHDPGILKVESNDPKELILFDINIHKKGIVSPAEFVKNFSHLRSAEVLYQGKLTEDFIKDVREGKYPSEEGVVCKGVLNPNNPHSQWRCKIKTWAYLKKIQKFFGNSYGSYWE
jgi:hypothetical protein